MAVSVLNVCTGLSKYWTMDVNHSGKRRVFVQTETGSVLGLELDGSDNAHTVKRRLQLALNIPTLQTSLSCGDMILKNDLSTVRNHSPLLLTRNCLHRSSSSPCLSPTPSPKDDEESDKRGPIEVIGCANHFPGTKQLVKEIVEAMMNGIDPVPIRSGLGGAYFFRGCSGENIAIIKPTDEEPFAPNNPKGFVGKALGQPGLKRSVRVGETGFREVAAYLLDYDGFANVPLTALVKVTHSIFNVNNDGVSGNNHQQKEQISKIASFQKFIPHDCDASDHGTSSFPVAAVHRIGILDIRILNTDRHGGNLLVRKLSHVERFDQVELVPIDHGLCLPETLEDPYFEWIHWPQASIPFSEDELEYIANLDPFHDSDMLRLELPMIREACLRILILCTTFLKAAATFGLCLAEIGEMMSRDFQGRTDEPSELELICIEARSMLHVRVMEDSTAKEDYDEFQFDFECDDHEQDSPRNSSRCLEDKPATKNKHHSKINGLNGTNTLFSLEEGAHEGQDEDAIAKGAFSYGVGNQGVKVGAGNPPHTASGIRNLHDQIPGDSSYVTLADMSEEEWLAFLDSFQKLLYPAFLNHKAERMRQGPRQRLGTSCKF